MTAHGAPLLFFLESLDIETNECILWPFGKTSAGYGTLYLKDGRVYVHVEALKRKKGPEPFIGAEAAHSCHSPSCFNYHHLNWRTRQENAEETDWSSKKMPRGIKNSNNRLTEDHIHWIRRQLEFGFKQKDIADAIGISKSQVNNIAHYQWKWLPKQEPYIKLWKDLNEDI